MRKPMRNGESAPGRRCRSEGSCCSDLRLPFLAGNEPARPMGAESHSLARRDRSRRRLSARQFAFPCGFRSLLATNRRGRWGRKVTRRRARSLQAPPICQAICVSLRLSFLAGNEPARPMGVESHSLARRDGAAYLPGNLRFSAAGGDAGRGAGGPCLIRVGRRPGWA